MKRFLMAMVFAGLLAVPAIAGDVSTSGSPAPPPSGSVPTVTTTSPGDIRTDGVAGQISDAALSALLTVLGLLG